MARHSLKFLPVLAILTLLPLSASADTTTSKFKWGIIGEHRYHRHIGDEHVYLTRPRARFVHNNWTDYPFIHGATFAKLIGHAEPLRGFWLDAELVAEHRGFSYGVYPTDQIYVFPRLQFGIDTSVSLNGERLGLALRVGNFGDLKLQEGLTIFNIDVQGADFCAGYRSLYLHINHIGDLEYSYGLNLNDWHTTSLELRDAEVGENVKLSSSFTLEGVSVAPTQWSAASRVRVRNFAFYGSVGHRPDLAFFQHNWATLFGSEIRVSGDSDFSIAGSIEYRYYSAGYNSRRYQGLLRYRAPQPIGFLAQPQFLYPLDRFDRPYVAWALYTQFQSEDVESLSAYCRARVRLLNDFWLHGMGEIVGLRTEFSGSPVIPFYEVSLNWEPSPGCFGRIGIGNRAMNLDEHFPTLYAVKGAAVVFGVGFKY